MVTRDNLGFASDNRQEQILCKTRGAGSLPWVDCNTPMQPTVTRIIKQGSAIVLILTKELQVATGWGRGDRIAARLAGEKLILERIPLENFARLRTGEAGEHAL